MTQRAPKRRHSDEVLLRGGPGWHYACDNPHMTECALAACQKARRCRLKDYFKLVAGGANGEEPGR